MAIKAKIVKKFPKNKNTNIPKFRTIEEEARFWDAHDLGDFMDEMRIVKGVYEPLEKIELVATLESSQGREI